MAENKGVADIAHTRCPGDNVWSVPTPQGGIRMVA
jgi:hypothetical protein